MTEAKYKVGDIITSYANVKGEVVERVYNEAINEWLYYCKDELMVVKQSNIKNESNNQTSNKRKKKGTI
jgi:hypothetical protein